jgi:hypothetical protein
LPVFFTRFLARQKMDEPLMNSGFANIFLWANFGQGILADLDTLVYDGAKYNLLKSRTYVANLLIQSTPVSP